MGVCGDPTNFHRVSLYRLVEAATGSVGSALQEGFHNLECIFQIVDDAGSTPLGCGSGI